MHISGPRSKRQPEVADDNVRDPIQKECKGEAWKQSLATLGRFDVVDIVGADDPKRIEKAAMIIRSFGHSTTETLVATPWSSSWRLCRHDRVGAHNALNSDREAHPCGPPCSAHTSAFTAN